MSSLPRLSGERVLVTGVLGCIGAWVARHLLEAGGVPVGFDPGASRHRLDLVLGPGPAASVEVVAGDVTDLGQVEAAIDAGGVTRVIHLAALQVPFVRGNPPLGSAVNVVGTANVLEAIRRRRDRLSHAVYVSSVAAYGPDDAGGEDERTRPDTLYGVTKVANEGTARLYWLESKVPSVALRPYTVYGPGRDQGLTSTPTQAMAAAARGEAFHIPWGGGTHMQHASDIARILLAAAFAEPDGPHVFNLGGATDMAAVVAAIEDAAPEERGRITFDDTPLPFPPRIETTPRLEALLGPQPLQPLAEGVRRTVEHLRAAGA